MTFLAPFFLSFAALAGVPLLVHLLRRRVTRTVDFPAVRYLARMEQEHSQERKVRHRLLLLLRILAVLALACAVARPLARYVGVGHAPIAVAIVVDNSLSTAAVHDGRVAFDALRAAARELLGALTADDRAWIITADGRIIGGTPGRVLDGLRTLEPMGGRGDVSAATRRALLLAQSGAPRAPVVAIVTDGQASAWSTPVADSTARAVDAGAVPIRVLRVPPPTLRNAAVVDAVVAPLHWTPSGTVTFAVTGVDSVPWRITLDGRTVARGTVTAGEMTAKGGAPVRVTQRLASNAVGWVRGSVEVDPDDVRGDDARAFAVRVAPPPRVRTAAATGPFLATALTTLMDEHRLQPADASDTAAVTVASADATISRGPVFLTAPSDPARIGDANRTLARLQIPWRFGALVHDPVQVRGRDGLDGVQVRMHYPLQWSPGAGAAALRAGRGLDTLAVAGAAPWAVAGLGYVLLGSPIDPEATDLPVRAPFVPWFLDVLARRLGEDGAVLHAVPGQPLAGRELAGATALERPDGTLLPITTERLATPDAHGVYFLRRDAVRVGALVVNAEPEESDARGDVAGPSSALRARVTGDRIAEDANAATWRTAVLQQAAGASLVWPLVLVALLALLAEAWLARPSSPDRVVDR